MSADAILQIYEKPHLWSLLAGYFWDALPAVFFAASPLALACSVVLRDAIGERWRLL
jgi:hypothetical protein